MVSYKLLTFIVSFLFQLRVLREPSLLAAFFLFEEFPDAPKTGSTQHTEKGREENIRNQKGCTHADDTRNQEHPPVAGARIIFYLDDNRRLYLEQNASVPETVESLKSQLAALRAQYPSVDFGSLDVQLANVKDEDWENNWKRYYQPLPIGERLLVVPEWLHPENPENRVEVLLDPGMIFGTGAHASTQMCMRELERAIQGGERVLDLGSGSGILSITAVLLGAAHATGVDIDPKAEDIARENAAINQIFSDRFTAVTGDVIGDRAMMESLRGHYDVVLANIVADVIIPLSRVVPEFLQEDSVFICSGILNTRLAEVLAALEQNGLQIISTEQQEDWCRVTAALPEA